MRRVLILLLVLLVPLKAVGAAVVPIVGSPNHQHTMHGVQVASTPVHHAGSHQHAAAHAGCEGMAQDSAAAGDVVHEHACPHLAMATVLPVVLVLPADRTAPFIAVLPARPLSSVVLDILVPPPTRTS